VEEETTAVVEVQGVYTTAFKVWCIWKWLQDLVSLQLSLQVPMYSDEKLTSKVELFFLVYEFQVSCD